MHAELLLVGFLPLAFLGFVLFLIILAEVLSTHESVKRLEQRLFPTKDDPAKEKPHDPVP